MNSLRLYWHYIGISMRSQMQYKASFFMMMVSQVLSSGMDFIGLWALFDRFHALRGWSLPEAGLLYGLVQISFSITEIGGRGFDIFPSMIKGGDFDRLLLRPRHTILQLLGQEVKLTKTGRLIQGTAVLIWSHHTLQIPWTLPKIALLVISLISGVCLFIGLFIVYATLCFWTVEGLEVMNITTYGGVQTAQYPLSIYKPLLRRFFTFVVPIACVNYLPSLAITGKFDSAGIPIWACWVASLLGFLFLLVAFRLWKFGVRRYCSTGS